MPKNDTETEKNHSVETEVEVEEEEIEETEAEEEEAEDESDEEESDEEEEAEEEDPIEPTRHDANGVPFDGNTKTRWKFNPDDVVILGIDDHCDDDDALADENVKDKLDEAQIKSVARDGVIQDIIICPKVINGELVPVVVDGRHRTRWARSVNKRAMAKTTVFVFARCVSKEVPDDVLRVGKHTLNYVRASRNIMSQAKAAKELSDAGRKNSEIAVDLGVSVSTVENFLALVNASKAVLDAVDKGKIPVTGAYKLAKLTPEKQAEAVKETLALAKETPKGRAKVSDAQTGKKRAKGEKQASSRPGIGKVRKLYDAAREDEDVLKSLAECEPIDFIRWLLGDVGDRVLPPTIRLALKAGRKKTAKEE